MWKVGDASPTGTSLSNQQQDCYSHTNSDQAIYTHGYTGQNRMSYFQHWFVRFHFTLRSMLSERRTSRSQRSSLCVPARIGKRAGNHAVHGRVFFISDVKPMNRRWALFWEHSCWFWVMFSMLVALGEGLNIDNQGPWAGRVFIRTLALAAVC